MKSKIMNFLFVVVLIAIISFRQVSQGDGENLALALCGMGGILAAYTIWAVHDYQAR